MYVGPRHAPHDSPAASATPPSGHERTLEPPVTALPMAGRAEELRAISEAWAARQIVVITGEAGMGKSRLVAEALAVLDPAPATVLAGHARSHAPAPYDWVASALSGRDLGELGVPADALGWLTQRPDAPVRRFAPDTLLRVAVDAVRELTGPAPGGVIVVEDLHHLDPASLSLVAELATVPALLVVTSRPPTTAAFPSLAGRVLARLSGTARSVRRHLGPLNPAETGCVIEAAFGSAEYAEETQARTGGNPYWLTELIAAHRGDSPRSLAEAPLPSHVAAMATENLSGEDPAVIRLAHSAALLGAAEAIRSSPDDESVRRLVHLGLFELGPGGEPEFRYPLLREAVAATVLPGERAALLAGEPDTPLTTREREVLGRIAAGMTNQQVASSLGISVRTVTVHVSNLLRKTGSGSRTEAALWAVRRGLSG
nr:LuxR C-terminal-related transcriptional regulator [Longispora albida]